MSPTGPKDGGTVQRGRAARLARNGLHPGLRRRTVRPGRYARRRVAHGTPSRRARNSSPTRRPAAAADRPSGRPAMCEISSRLRHRVAGPVLPRTPAPVRLRRRLAATRVKGHRSTRATLAEKVPGRHLARHPTKGCGAIRDGGVNSTSRTRRGPTTPRGRTMQRGLSTRHGPTTDRPTRRVDGPRAIPVDPLATATTVTTRSPGCATAATTANSVRRSDRASTRSGGPGRTDLAGQREDSGLVRRRHGLHCAVTEFGQPLENATHQNLRHRRP